MVEKFETIKIPEWVLEAGNLMGTVRNLNGYHMNKNPQFNRGTEQNFTGHINGMTGELIFAMYLERKELEYKMSPIFGLTKTFGGDFVVCGNITFDVKTITQEQTHFNINVDAHKKKPIDFYALIQYGQSEAKIIIVRYQFVETWNVQRSFTDYYSKSINELKTTQQHHEKN